MKRGADKQLTKDGIDDDEIEEITDQSFQKADEATLARRQIRALPKRSLAASKPPVLNGLPPISAIDVDKAEATPLPKFGGFVGFGAGTAPSNPFTFTAQPSASPPHAFEAASKPTQPIPSVSSFFGVPKQTPSDPDTSFLPKPADETDPAAFKYFKSLRGLNVSFLSAISTAVGKDPFCDVANLVESYKNLRTTIQSEFDSSSLLSVTHSAFTPNSAPSFGTKSPPEKPSLFFMPKPPSGSAEAPSKLPSASESSTKTGFTFAPFVPPSSSTPSQLPFSEPPKSTTATTPDVLKSVGSSAPSTGFTFVASSTIEDVALKPAPVPSGQETERSFVSSSSRPTSTAPSLEPSSVPNFFATTKPTNVFGISDASSKLTSVFGNSTSGSSTIFGNATAASSSTPANIFRPSSDKSVTVFGSASPPKTSTFAFGKSAGSIGNPVGFGFGNLTPSTGDTAVPGPSSSGFSFGVPTPKPTDILFSPPMTDKSSESTPQPEEGNEEGGEDDAARLLPSRTHDEEGEGEEDEDTTYVLRCKVYRMFKSGGKSEWKDLGVGMFRLKKHKETNMRRALMRNSSTGRIVINFRISENLKPVLGVKAVSFVGYEDNAPTPFSLRVKTEEQALDLKQALEREIAAVQTV